MERTYSTPLMDKLGVGPGTRVGVIGVEDRVFRDLLRTRTSDVTLGAPASGAEVIFLAADTLEQLFTLRELRSRIVPSGAIWVVSRKGKGRTIRDVDVIAAAKSAGLVDNKVVSFSDTHSALRLVIPKADRTR